uniref:Uncharacterized protein AlNc14C6G904 n=1 Tax=Albugo laibachii Nc14 TaxID=890382 RepID=F0W1D5_9STRA|nr:conserved hypothetical protein [Albugo laibachii Nc14]|eukprot:CCA14863.1 conserved hypothetical protein [Albugo laibachii Nc14]
MSRQKRPTRKKSKQAARWKHARVSFPFAIVLLAVVVGVYRYWCFSNSHDTYLSRYEKVHRHESIPCAKAKRGFVPGCTATGSKCGRSVRDAFVSIEEIQQLREIAKIGMANRSHLGGPTIMDANSGFVKDGDGLVNIYGESQVVGRFSKKQLELYRNVVENIRKAVMEEFQLEVLHFTAPTFITRIIGNASWTPREMHDEYWHLHVDKNNTPHYDYSALLYLSDYAEEFTGGLFAFKDKTRVHVVEPSRGRLLMFTSGKENLHHVRKVRSGTRYVMSMWFSCDAQRAFRNFWMEKRISTSKLKN